METAGDLVPVATYKESRLCVSIEQMKYALPGRHTVQTACEGRVQSLFNLDMKGGYERYVWRGSNSLGGARTESKKMKEFSIKPNLKEKGVQRERRRVKGGRL